MIIHITIQTLQSVKDWGMVFLKPFLLLFYSFDLFYGHMTLISIFEKYQLLKILKIFKIKILLY